MVLDQKRKTQQQQQQNHKKSLSEPGIEPGASAVRCITA